VPTEVSPQTRQQLRYKLNAQQNEQEASVQHEVEAATIRDRFKQSWLKKMQHAKGLYHNKPESDHYTLSVPGLKN